MLIGINIQYLIEKVGFGTVTRELLKGLNKIDNKNQYILYYNKPIKSEEEKALNELNLNKNKFKIKSIPVKSLFAGAPKSLRNKAFWEMFKLPNTTRKDKIDLFISPYQCLSKFKCKHIMLVLDVIFKVFPPNDLKKDFIGKAYYYLQERAIKHSDKILTISEHSKKDISKYLNINENKIKNIFCACSNDLKILNDQNKKSVWEKIQTKYKIKKPYFITIGNPEPRKNFKLLLETFKEFIKKSGFKNYNLVFIGKKNLSEDLIKIGYVDFKKKGKSLGIEKHIFAVGNASDEDKLFLLNHAQALVFPSLYEGFGLPPLEAFASGCPVISSNSSSLPEVIGNAGIMINPNSKKELLSAMIKIASNKDLRNDLIKKGLEQKKKFSWEKTVRLLLREI